MSAARAGWTLATAMTVLAVSAAAAAQDEEPPPWESGDFGEDPSWESGAAAEDGDEGEPGKAPAEPPAPEVELAPPGEDTETPYRPRTDEMESSPRDELGVMLREEDDVTWTVITTDAWGPVAYGGLGYEAGDEVGHLVFSGGAGWTVAGEWHALRAEGRDPRLEGSATNLFLTMDLGADVSDSAATSFLTIGVRAQQVFAFGKHMLSGQLGLGGRKDLDTGLGGVDLTFGIGYAYAMAPFAIPVNLEMVRHWTGVFDEDGAWGARITVGWPIWFSL